MKKILSIVWYKVLPPVFGGQKGIAGFNHELSLHHSLVCMCSRNNEPATGLHYRLIPILPLSKMQFINPRVIKDIRLVIKKEKPDFIILEHPYHGRAVSRARKQTGTRILVHSHNIESERFRQLGKWWWRILRAYESRVHRSADLSIFKTEEDRQFALGQFKIHPDKCVVVPYGIIRPVINENAGQLIRQRHGIDKQQKILLFAGTLDYKPNAIAVENIYKKIVPALSKTGIAHKLIICGRNRPGSFKQPDAHYHPDVINAGEVTDIDNYFQAADAFINPVAIGAGMQTKNIDALANHCNVIGFEPMTTGIPAHLCGNKLFTAARGDWETFVQLTIKAMEHKQPTPEPFFAYFGWENCIQPLLQKLKVL